MRSPAEMDALRCIERITLMLEVYVAARADEARHRNANHPCQRSGAIQTYLMRRGIICDCRFTGNGSYGSNCDDQRCQAETLCDCAPWRQPCVDSPVEKKKAPGRDRDPGACIRHLRSGRNETAGACSKYAITLVSSVRQRT